MSPTVNAVDLPPVLFAFSYHNEDAEVEQALLQHIAETNPDRAAADLRVCNVAGCGTHALVFCASPYVARVDTVDVSSAQTMVASYTAAAASVATSPEDLAALLGSGGNARERKERYKADVRAHLAEAAQHYWDAHVDTIALGIFPLSGVERMSADVRPKLPKSGSMFGKADEIRAAFATTATPEKAGKNFPGFLGNEEGSKMVAYVFTEMGEELIEGLAEFEQDTSKPLNLFHRILLLGKYPLDPGSARPVFLQEATFATLKERGCGRERLQVHEGPVQEVAPRLAEDGGKPFDVIDVSNAVDANEDGAQVIKSLMGALAPGGVLLARRSKLGASKTERTLAQVFAECGLDVDARLCERLTALETSKVMIEVCAGFKRFE